MTTEKRYDDGLEEIWRIKREICAGYASTEDYFRSVLDDQERARRQGVRFIRLPLAHRPHCLA